MVLWSACSLNWTISLDHVLGALVFEDIRQSVSPAIFCLFLLILCVVHHHFSPHLVLRVFARHENHPVPCSHFSTALLRPIDPVFGCPAGPARDRILQCHMQRRNGHHGPGSSVKCDARAPKVRLEDNLNTLDSLIWPTSPAAGV